MLASPPPDFALRPLPLRILSLTGYLRIYRSQRRPVEFTRSDGRFDPPDHRFGVMYAGNSLACCLAETVVKDRGGAADPAALPTEDELAGYAVVDLAATRPARLIDLTDPRRLPEGLSRAVIEDDDDTACRAWALAFWSHPERPDGLIYPSRQHETSSCLALFDRIGEAIRAARTMPLLRRPELPRALRQQPAGT